MIIIIIIIIGFIKPVLSKNVHSAEKKEAGVLKVNYDLIFDCAAKDSIHTSTVWCVLEWHWMKKYAVKTFPWKVTHALLTSNGISNLF